MANAFCIVSYVGADPLLFGLKEDQVEKHVGSPLRSSVNNLGEKNAQFDSFSIRYSKTDQSLVEIGFSPSARVSFDKLDLFGDRDVFQKLLARDSHPYEYFGFIILLSLGITLTGFHDNDADQRAVTAFAHGRWDHLQAKFKNYKGF